MTRLLLPALLAALALPAVPAAHAPLGDCDSNGKPALGIVEITTGHARATFYLDDRNYLENGIWVYQETGGNGWTARPAGVYADAVAAHNLQRGGASFLVPDDTETCVDDPLALPDALVF